MASTRQPPTLSMPHGDDATESIAAGITGATGIAAGAAAAVAGAAAGAGSLLASSGLPLPDRPPIAALFLIEFDVKAGYTIAWKQAVRGLDLSGAVEYKSLPSGLHAVSEDLIYFVHEGEEGATAAATTTTTPADGEGGYAGLSAFVNLPTDEADARYARMIAVGVLVPRSYGRLGRAWRHADALMTMARKLAADRNEIPLLEEYWHSHSSISASTNSPPPLLQTGDSPLTSPTVNFSFCTAGRARHIRNRSASDGTALQLPPGHRLAPHHPAWSLTSLLDTFGPLVFPIYRAALLRKRILISTQAPVREVNNFVYNISVLANIPISVLDILDPAAVPQQRIRPLFTIGVNDIPFLVQDHAASKRATTSDPGWVACTTDSILAMKGELWDVLITMPPAHANTAAASPTLAAQGSAHDKKIWPTVEVAKGVPVKATQRDLRRFLALRTGLERLGGSWAAAAASSREGLNEGDAASIVSNVSNVVPKIFWQPDAQLVDATESIVEPVTWAALAYNGFMWWASAGEQRRAEDAEESIQDASLLTDLTSLGPATLSPHMQRPPQPQRPRRQAANADDVEDEDVEEDDEEEEDDNVYEEEDRARVELAIIAYFHRLTTQMLSVVADIVESSEGEAAGDLEENDDDEEDDDDDAASSDGLLSGRRRRHHGVRSSGSGSGSGSGSDARPLSGDTAATATSSSAAAAAAASTIHINSDALTRMGLDVWSQGDAVFVRDLVLGYFGRHAVQVEGKGIEVCGLKIC